LVKDGDNIYFNNVDKDKIKPFLYLDKFIYITANIVNIYDKYDRIPCIILRKISRVANEIIAQFIFVFTLLNRYRLHCG